MFFAGRVLVNCFMGISRSSTCVLAFLMLRRGMGAAQALEQVRRRRVRARPNEGFLRQLAELELTLRSQENTC